MHEGTCGGGVYMHKHEGTCGDTSIYVALEDALAAVEGAVARFATRGHIATPLAMDLSAATTAALLALKGWMHVPVPLEGMSPLSMTPSTCLPSRPAAPPPGKKAPMFDEPWFPPLPMQPAGPDGGPLLFDIFDGSGSDCQERVAAKRRLPKKQRKKLLEVLGLENDKHEGTCGVACTPGSDKHEGTPGGLHTLGCDKHNGTFAVLRTLIWTLKLWIWTCTCWVVI